MSWRPNKWVKSKSIEVTTLFHHIVQHKILPTLPSKRRVAQENKLQRRLKNHLVSISNINKAIRLFLFTETSFDLNMRPHLS